jgi:aspartate carbamoyltransferase catalytic subunit
VNVLRIQTERQEQGLFPSLREYALRWGITPERLAACASDVTVMHPGPMNRGVEISADVADADYAVIEEQVTNGVAVRMALLYLLLGGDAGA